MSIVSIHAPRAGCDYRWCRRLLVRCSVSIHAPRAGCDLMLVLINSSPRCFNSRTPCGVRLTILIITRNISSFNSRTPCGVRLRYKGDFLLLARFNSRTPCGVRHTYRQLSTTSLGFNSRTPCGVRLRFGIAYRSSMSVSIHAPRAGCDNKILLNILSILKFQFTHPVRGATSGTSRASAN